MRVVDKDGNAEMDEDQLEAASESLSLSRSWARADLEIAK